MLKRWIIDFRLESWWLCHLFHWKRRCRIIFWKNQGLISKLNFFITIIRYRNKLFKSFGTRLKFRSFIFLYRIISKCKYKIYWFFNNFNDKKIKFYIITTKLSRRLYEILLYKRLDFAKLRLFTYWNKMLCLPESTTLFE